MHSDNSDPNLIPARDVTPSCPLVPTVSLPEFSYDQFRFWNEIRLRQDQIAAQIHDHILLARYQAWLDLEELNRQNDTRLDALRSQRIALGESIQLLTSQHDELTQTIRGIEEADQELVNINKMVFLSFYDKLRTAGQDYFRSVLPAPPTTHNRLGSPFRCTPTVHAGMLRGYTTTTSKTPPPSSQPVTTQLWSPRAKYIHYKCDICDEMGHIQWNCLRYKCPGCLTNAPGHKPRNCDYVCPVCRARQPGHAPIDCPQNITRLRGGSTGPPTPSPILPARHASPCRNSRCEGRRHYKRFCPYYQCRHCKSNAPGHFPRDCPLRPSSPAYSGSSPDYYPNVTLYDHDNDNGEC